MDKNFRDLLETVNFIKDQMVTKTDLAEVEFRLDAKIDRIDQKLSKFEEHEIDKRLQLEVRVTKIEKHIDLHPTGRS